MSAHALSAHAARIAAYRAFLDGQALRFGFAKELADLALRQRNGVQNDTPPEVMWPRIIPTVRLVETIREQFGPTTITSAFRSPAYNAAVAESTNSQHSHNRAIDFQCATGTPAEWRRTLLYLRGRGAFKGGIGLYRTFVHIDTRGVNADWTG